MSCSWCSKRAGLQCSKCRMVSYCCREHQVADFGRNHKSLCKDLAEKTAKVKQTEKELRAECGDDLFVDYVGHFWKIHETRPYMRSRSGVTQALERMGSKQSLEAAINNILDLLRLCRGDNMGMRDLVPGMMLRVGHEQEAYDFMKWWCTHPDNYDWGNMKLPYLNIKNADVFEPVLKSFSIGKFGPSLHYTAAMTLIKFRLLSALKETKAGNEAFGSFLVGTHKRLGANSPISRLSGSEHVLMLIRDFAAPATTRLVPSRVFVAQRGGLDVMISCISAQVTQLLDAGDIRNARLWPALVYPDPLLSRPMARAYSHDSVEEVQLCLENVRPSWIATPGAMQLLIKRVGGKKPNYDTKMFAFGM